MVIKNFGDNTFNNLEWEIDIYGKFIFSGSETKGVISSIAPGEEITINAHVFGFGRQYFLHGNPMSKHLAANMVTRLNGFGDYGIGGFDFLVFGPFVFMFPRYPTEYWNN